MKINKKFNYVCCFLSLMRKKNYLLSLIINFLNEFERENF